MSSSAERARGGLAVFLLLCPLPVLGSLAYAGLYSVGLSGLLAHGFTLDHWRRVLSRGELWSSLGLSLFVAASTVLLTTALALPLALALKDRLRSGALPHLVALPLAVPASVAAFLVVQAFGGAGLASRLAFRLGLSRGIADFPALTQDPWAAGIVLAHVGLAVPFFLLLFAELQGSLCLPALVEVAESLGARPGQSLVRIVVPLLLGRALPNLALLFVVVLGSYEIPLLLGRQSPQMLSVLTLRKYAMFDLSEKPEAFIVALAYMGIVTAIVALVFRGRRPVHGL